MSEPTLTPYRISEQDYLRSSRLGGRLRTRHRNLLLAGVFVLVAMALYSLKVGDRATAYPLVAGIGGGGLVALALRLLVQPMLMRRQYRRYALMQQEQRVGFAPEGLHFQSAVGEAVVHWANFHGWRENEAFLVLFIAPRVFYVLPKRIAEAGFPLEALRNALAREVGPSC
ncbi:YcxB family protein [Metapseudomonas otitidis]|uniref:YcxB family protein n=1 Tax=Metapseudomonas otitidis TaxID=319939 RepID=UPI0013F5AC06|nr:YcxB family protein [Pseudomonas otitidis]